MAGKVLKLYRGLSSDEFNLATDEVFRRNKDTWASILAYRVKGSFKYPQQLDRSINVLNNSIIGFTNICPDELNVYEGEVHMIGLLPSLRGQGLGKY
jgi:hypothetical protein